MRAPLRHVLILLASTAVADMGCAPSTPDRGAQEQSAPAIVLLVRHGEKAPQPGNDQPLSDDGVVRAAALASALRDAGVTRVITTQWRRTQQTAAPIAQLRHLRPVVIPVDLNHVAAYVQAVADTARRGSGVTLVVGHQNTIPAVITALGGPTIPEPCADDYGDLYVLVIDPPASPSLTHAEFGRPHPEHATSCATPPAAGSAAPRSLTRSRTAP
jgi:broad specificity phosphatase PhoE